MRLLILALVITDNVIGTGKQTPFRSRRYIHAGRSLVERIKCSFANTIEKVIDGFLARLVRSAEWVIKKQPQRTRYILKEEIPIAQEVHPLVVQLWTENTNKMSETQERKREGGNKRKPRIKAVAAQKVKPTSYEQLSVGELVDLCKEKGIKANKRWKKETLIKKLEENRTSRAS